MGVSKNDEIENSSGIIPSTLAAPHWFSMQLLLVRFLLRNSLTLPEGKRIYFVFDGRGVALKAETKETLALFSYDGWNLEWVGWNDEAQTITIREDTAPKDQDIFHLRLGTPIQDFTGGVITPSRSTVLSVVFETDDFDLADSVTFNAHVDWAEKLVGRFIDTYRWRTGDAAVPSFNTLEMGITLVGVAKAYTFNEQTTNAAFTMQQHRIKIQHPILYGRRKEPVAQPIVDVIKSDMASSAALAPFQALLIEARELSFLSNAEEQAIIVAETALEVFLQGRLTEVCVRNRRTHLPAKKGGDPPVPFRTAIQEGNVTSDLLRYAGILAPGTAIRGSAEEQRWRSNAYVPRNLIVHRGKRGVTKTDTDAAILAVNNFILYLDRLL